MTMLSLLVNRFEQGVGVLFCGCAYSTAMVFLPDLRNAVAVIYLCFVRYEMLWHTYDILLAHGFSLGLFFISFGVSVDN